MGAIYTTEEQEEFLNSLVSDGSIKDRLRNYGSLTEDALSDFDITLKLLYDGNGEGTEAKAFEIRERAVKNFCDKASSILGKPELRTRLEQYLHTYVFPYYDWLAFKSIYRDLAKTSEAVKLHHVLSVITKSLLESIALPTRELFTKEKSQTLPVYINYRQRLEGALRAYKLLIFKLFKYRIGKADHRVLKLYDKFFEDAFNYSVNFEFSKGGKDSVISRDNFISSVSYATLNWDPVIPFYLIKQAKLTNDKITSSGKKGLCKLWSTIFNL